MAYQWEMTEDHAKALLLLAYIPFKQLYRLENQYWPEAYVEERRGSPWWLAHTEWGVIRMGWRKRVFSIQWEGTEYRGIITEDSTTKDAVMVHAWGYPKAVEYLSDLGRHLRLIAKQKIELQPVSEEPRNGKDI